MSLENHPLCEKVTFTFFPLKQLNQKLMLRLKLVFFGVNIANVQRKLKLGFLVLY